MRRLEALKLLGCTETKVSVVDIDAVVRGEFAENAHRKNFTPPSEIDAIRRAIEPIEKAAAASRKLSGRSCQNGGDVRDKVGALAGVSGRTIEKIKAVVDAVNAEPAKLRHLVKQMDRTHRWGPSETSQDARRGAHPVSLSSQEGSAPSSSIPHDPTTGPSAAPVYANMSPAELLERPVPSWATAAVWDGVPVQRCVYGPQAPQSLGARARAAAREDIR